MNILDFIKKNILSKFKNQKFLPEETKDYSKFYNNSKRNRSSTEYY
jgi:hypothetical protein